MILRDRGAVARFHAHHGLHAGSEVAIKHGADRDYFLEPTWALLSCGLLSAEVPGQPDREPAAKAG